MYEKDGKKYFIFDSHLHFWDAVPANWVKGAEEYAKGWIECFHAYQGLGPAETHWTLEHFQKYSVDDFEKDVFIDGDVDKAVFQSTYLKEWYTNGFNDIEQNAALLERFPDKLIVNGRWDPREGEAGLRAARGRPRQVRHQGRQALHGRVVPGLARLEARPTRGAKPFLDKCVELGIKNIHVHKGPTIWPLDKDAFDVSDVDHVATDYNGELNFIVEHVGLPRIEDFCFMATQEPNVYAGLVGGHRRPHARPPEVLREGHGRAAVLGRRGQDAVRLRLRRSGSRSGRSRASSTGRCPTTTRSRLPAAGRRGQEEDPRPQRRQAVRRRGARRSCQDVAGRRAGRRRTSAVGVGVTLRVPSPRSARDGLRPGARRADHHARLRRLLRRDRRGRRVGAPAASDAAVRAELRVPDGGGRARRGLAACAGVRAVDDRARGPLHGRRRSTRPSTPAGAFSDAFPGETRGELDALRALFQRKALVARQARLLARSTRRRALGELHRARRGALPRAAPGARDRRVRRRARRSSPATATPVTADDVRFRRMASLTALSLETNGGMCRDLLRVRYGGGGRRMKAARLHKYHEALKVEEIDEPKIARAATT